MDLPDVGWVWSGHHDLLHLLTDGNALSLIRQVKCSSGDFFLCRGPRDLVFIPLVRVHECSVLEVFRVPPPGANLKNSQSRSGTISVIRDQTSSVTPSGTNKLSLLGTRGADIAIKSSAQA